MGTHTALEIPRILWSMLDDAEFVGFIPVRSLEMARLFYCDVLGLELGELGPVAVVVSSGGVRLRLTEVPDLRPQPFTVAGWLVDDVASTASSLISAGVSMKRYEGMLQDEQGIWTTPSGDQVAWFSDPDGNVLSITSRAA
jgi:catechol 2,3-dioxygenase-like lactoylglutathione lyase family enzyme